MSAMIGMARAEARPVYMTMMAGLTGALGEREQHRACGTDRGVYCRRRCAAHHVHRVVIFRRAVRP